MSITSERRQFRSCPCGCRQRYPLFSGLMTYGESNSVAFHAAHMQHANSGPHLWLLLGTGPWFDDDERGCWVVLHAWIVAESLITRVEDMENSPFLETDVFGERLLRRDEALSKEGGVEWAIARREQFAVEHQATVEFILKSDVAQQAVAADSPKTGAG